MNKYLIALTITIVTISLLISSCGYMNPSNPPSNMPHDPGMMDGTIGENQPAENDHDEDHQEVPAPPQNMSVDVKKAENTFLQNCARCHGVNLQGGGPYPSLQKVGLTHTKDDILHVIKTGPSVMPANLVTGEEAENLAKWLWTKR